MNVSLAWLRFLAPDLDGDAESLAERMAEQPEMPQLDPESGVYLAHRASRVAHGTIERGGEELALHRLQAISLDALEEGAEERIGKDPSIEVEDHPGDGGLAADALVEALRRLTHHPAPFRSTRPRWTRHVDGRQANTAIPQTT